MHSRLTPKQRSRDCQETCTRAAVRVPHACSCASGKGSPDEYYFNPLKCPLPRAPSMQMFCLYGTSIDTERSYYYLNLESNKACTLP